MDSTTIVNYLTQHLGSDWAKVIYGIIVMVIPVLYRIFIAWANNRKTTWYWNPVTKQFALKWLDRQLGKICGRGVNDSNFKYEDSLPPEAVEVLRKRIEDKFPTDVLK